MLFQVSQVHMIQYLQNRNISRSKRQGEIQLSNNLTCTEEKNSKRGTTNFNFNILQGNNNLKALNLGQPSKTVSETEKIQIEDSDVSIALRKGVRSCTVHPLSNFVKYNHLSNSVHSLVKNLEVVEIPKTVQEALESLQWKQAILDEMRALEKNQTWKVVPRPHNKVHVGCRWVFTVKKQG